MAEERRTQAVSPTYGPISDRVFRVISQRFAGKIGPTTYETRMRRLGYTATPALNLLGEYGDRAITFEPIAPPPPPPPPPEYTLTIRIEGKGTVYVSPDLPVYAPGTSVSLTALPEDRWRFDRWSGDLTGTERRPTFVITSDMKITAHFASEEYEYVEYVKYFIYDPRGGPASDKRHFEVRAIFTVQTDVKPDSRTVLRNLEKLFDEIMTEEGIDVTHRKWKHEYPVRRRSGKKGAEPTGTFTPYFDRSITVEIHDIIRDYKYTRTITLTEEDMVE